MRRYDIRRADRPVPLTGLVAPTPWAAARPLWIDRYPWYAAGQRQATTVRMLYDAAGLYVQFRCRDRHASAEVTRLNGMVCEDSCVEFFAAAHPEASEDYFNLEVNCCGCMHLGFGPGRHGRRLVSAERASRIVRAASVAGPTKAPSPADRRWWLAVALPWDVLSGFVGRPVRPKAGDLWRGNCYRCGGRIDPQYACWNPVATPAPDYHRPEFFGTLRFV